MAHSVYIVSQATYHPAFIRNSPTSNIFLRNADTRNYATENYSDHVAPVRNGMRGIEWSRD